MRNKINTKLIYELNKFNLLREENEGFSRVISELTQPNINESNVQAVIENIFSLIGFFRVDPNRVIDIILDWYSMMPENRSFSEILKAFDKTTDCNNVIEGENESSIPYILKFKLKRLYEIKQDASPLIKLAAYMIKNDEMQIEDVLFQSDSILQDYSDINSLEAAYNDKSKIYLNFMNANR